MADTISRIATAVADGATVDWVHEMTRRPEHLESMEQFSILERIRRAHESVDPSQASTRTASAPLLAETTIDASTEVEKPLFRWSRLDVLEKIGEGTGGEVYRAMDPILNSVVALKLLRPDYADSPQLVQRFLDEARRLARVRHPNVVTVHGAGEHDGRVGLWTEYIAGCSLEQVITQQGRLSACEAAVIGLDLCRALAAVHAAGLIHRDVKTTNVMREEGGRIVLMDFGSVSESPASGAARWTGGVQGTALYMAPEQLRGEVAGPPTDIYELGVLLYRLVTKRFPIEAPSLGELNEEHSRGGHVSIRDRRADLPLEFIQVVERALNPDPAERYATSGEMELDLARTLGAMARREVIRRRVRWAVAGSMASVALVAGVLVGREYLAKPVHTPVPSQVTMRAVAPVAPAPLTATAILQRRVGEHDVTLGRGDSLRPRDALSLLVNGSDTMYVYVVDTDAAGKVFTLYPLPEHSSANPLPGGMSHRLPGDRETGVTHWIVDSAGGKESIIAIGSRRPIEFLEKAMAEGPVARPRQHGVKDPMAPGNLRGIGEVQTLPMTDEEANRRLKDAVNTVREDAKKTGDLWVWSIDLENP